MGTNYGFNTPQPKRTERRIKKGHVFRRSQPAPMVIHKSFWRQERFWLSISAFCVILGLAGLVFLYVHGFDSGLKSSTGFVAFFVAELCALIFGVTMPIFLRRRYLTLQRVLDRDNTQPSQETLPPPT